MLLQAVQDAISVSNGRRSSALRWINKKDEGAFSFTFVCRVLNRDSEEVRQFCLRKMAERRAPEPIYRALFEQTQHSYPASAA